MRFGDYLRSYKIDHNLTVKKMSKLTGVPEGSIWRHLYRSNIPQPTMFAKYSVLFGNNDCEFLKKLYDYFWDEERAYRMGLEKDENE